MLSAQNIQRFSHFGAISGFICNKLPFKLYCILSLANSLSYNIHSTIKKRTKNHEITRMMEFDSASLSKKVPLPSSDCLSLKLTRIMINLAVPLKLLLLGVRFSFGGSVLLCLIGSTLGCCIFPLFPDDR